MQRSDREILIEMLINAGVETISTSPNIELKNGTTITFRGNDGLLNITRGYGDADDDNDR